MFDNIYYNFDWNSISHRIYSAEKENVKHSILSGGTDIDDIINLLSPAADEFLEDMAVKSASITRQRFGNIIQMYTPLYISNLCTNSCLYCGFNRDNSIKRTTLTPEQIKDEADYIYKMGFRHILLLTGEDKNAVSPEKLAEIVSVIHRKFSSISIEVYPMSSEEYTLLINSGVDGLTVYQETYNKDVYSNIHPSGKKRDFNWRLLTPDRGGEAGMRRIGIGPLMGLTDWRVELFFTALHAIYLTKKFWKSQITVSFPRLRNAAGGFQPLSTVSDRDLTHAICVMRILLNDAGLVLSTRESEELRNNLMPLGITMMSSGSKTDPGGHTTPNTSESQFEISDTRTPDELALYIKNRGFEPVWKDWDRDFTGNL